MSGELVSIVMPVHNCECFVEEAICSVATQTYGNWELIVVDDCSTDDTVNVVENYVSDRIRLIRLHQNRGAAIARNTGVAEARGEYLAFIDADDLWLPEKLEQQVKFMQEKDCEFSFTGYEFADAEGRPNGKVVRVPATITYKQALRNTTIWTSTVMFDMRKLSRKDVEMPNVQRGQDTATWWKVLKKVNFAHGLNEVLSYYRRSSGSLSSNKITALKRTWNLYRNVERLGFCKSCGCFVAYCFNAVKRRV